MPIIRAINNKLNDEPNNVTFGPYSVTWGPITLNYSEIEVVGFSLKHSQQYGNGIPLDDTLEYFIRIDSIILMRSHSSVIRVTSKARSKGQTIQNEFNEYMGYIERYILPNIFTRKVSEFLGGKEITLGGVRFSPRGTVSIKNKSFDAKDLDAKIASGSVLITNNGKRTLFGRPKQVGNISLIEDNACLIAPMLEFVNQGGVI